MRLYRAKCDAILAAKTSGEITQDHAAALYRALVDRLFKLRGKRTPIEK